MGPGGVLNAEFALRASVDAGTYRLVCDGVILRAVDVTFQVVWAHGDTEDVIGEVTQHFDPRPGGKFDAEPCDLEIEGTAIAHEVGDQLILRFLGANTTSDQAYIPNGDGSHAKGRIPNLTLP